MKKDRSPYERKGKCPTAPHHQSPSSSVHSPMTKSKRRSRDLQGPSHTLNTVYLMKSNGETTTIMAKGLKGRERAGQGRNGRNGWANGLADKGRDGRGNEYVHAPQLWLSKHHSPTFSPHLTTPQRYAHTHTNIPPPETKPTERGRGESGESRGPKESKQASIWETEFFLYPSIHTYTRRRGAQGLRVREPHPQPAPRLLFLLSLNSVYLRTSFLWSFLFFFLFSYTLVSQTILFVYCPRAVLSCCA